MALAALENWDQSSWDVKFRVLTPSVILCPTLLHPETLNFTWMASGLPEMCINFAPSKSFFGNLVWSLTQCYSFIRITTYHSHWSMWKPKFRQLLDLPKFSQMVNSQPRFHIQGPATSPMLSLLGGFLLPHHLHHLPSLCLFFFLFPWHSLCVCVCVCVLGMESWDSWINGKPF